MRNYLVKILAFSLLLLALPAIASAQYRNDDDDDYYRTDRRGGYDQRNLKGVVERLKNRAKEFERAVDRYEDDDDYYGRGRRGSYGNNIENLADRFADAADDLEDEFGNGRNLNNSRDEASRLVNIAQQLDQAIYNQRSNRYLERDWRSLSRDVQQIAYAYNLNYNSRNNRGWGNGRGNGRGNGTWDKIKNFPFPF